MGRPQKSFEPHRDPKNSPAGPKKAQKPSQNLLNEIVLTQEVFIYVTILQKGFLTSYQ